MRLERFLHALVSALAANDLMVTAPNQILCRRNHISRVWIVVGGDMHLNTRVFWLLFRVTLLMKGRLLQRLVRRTTGSVTGWVRLDCAYLGWIQTCWIVWLGCSCWRQPRKQTNIPLPCLIALMIARWDLGKSVISSCILLISLILLELPSHCGWIICCSCGVSVMLVLFGSNLKLAEDAASAARVKVCRLLTVASYFLLLWIRCLIRIVLYSMVEQGLLRALTCGLKLLTTIFLMSCPTDLLYLH